MPATPMTVKKIMLAILAIVGVPTCVLGQAAPEPLPLNLRRSYDRAKFVDMAHGYVFGSSDATAIIATEDGGTSWRLVKDVTLSTWDVPLLPRQRVLEITSVAFSGTDRFWVLMRRCALLRTLDGGRSFKAGQVRYVGKKGEAAPRICGGLSFSSPGEGWLAAGSVLLHTSDAGEHWGSVPLPQGVRSLWQVWMFDDRSGVATGDGVIITDDGGRTWRAVQGAPKLADAQLSCSASGFCAVLTGPHGPLVVSRDHGHTWGDSGAPFKPGHRDELFEAHVFDSDRIVVVGSDVGYTVAEFLASGPTVNLPNAQGLLLTWNGTVWTRITHEQPQAFFGAHFLDENSGWLFASNNGIYKTTDGGHTLEFVADYFRRLAAGTPSPAPAPTPVP